MNPISPNTEPSRRIDTIADDSPRKVVIMLVLRTLTSWGYTARLLVLLLTLAALAFAALWFLNINVELGPIRISNTTRLVVT